jgi:RHS repeat-associated protein
MTKTTIRNTFEKLGLVGILFCTVNLVAQTPSSGENYIKTTTYKVETTATITNPTAQQAVVEITYIDGLGRPKQKIAHQQAGDGGDIVTHIAYDGFGRQPLEFLPYVRSASQSFDGNGLGSTTAFYSNSSNGPTTSNPWSEKLFEESPLNRVLKQAAPGNDWAMNGGHEVKFSYETNTANEVHYFKVNLTTNNPTLEHNGKYPMGHLYKNVTKDENWQPGDIDKGTVVKYTDKMGRMVLKRTFDKASTGNTTITLDTYYVYDVYGNLTFVLPPKLSEQIPANGTILQPKLDALAYQYKYDHRNRMIHKQIPGKHREFMVYDALDRLVATGPALSPFGDQVEGWLRTKYDVFNRVAYTFWQQGVANQQTRINLTNGTPAFVSEERLSGNNTNTVNGIVFSYTNRVAPTSSYHILTINYYDDYLYNGAPATIPSTVANGQSDVYYKKTTQKPKGMPTGSWVRQLETAAQNNAITSYSLYDIKARPVRVNSTNAANGYTQTDTEFDFTTITKHKKYAGASELVITDAFFYTPQSRPLKHSHKIGNGTAQLMALNQYDALGRLESKQVGGPDSFGTNYLQKIDYKYNIRGWMTDINDVDNLSKAGDPLDLFAFHINYNTITDAVNGAVKELYNGNISETFWRTSSDNIKRKYGYGYDYQNRLLGAYYQLPGTAIPLADSYSAHYSYDSNGNILTLTRNGEQDFANTVLGIDDLAYVYDEGNKLVNVRDYESVSMGYHDSHISSVVDDFYYDTYGNLIEDKDKQITAITYNHLNLPTKILFSSGGKIEYFYDATGIKLKKKVTDGTTITNTEYMDGYQYTNSIIDFFPTAEGYVKVVSGQIGTNYKYIFNYTDHLGNIRLKYSENPSTGEVAILEENHYYPYGLTHKGYNGNHKVFTEDAGGNITLTPVTPLLNDSYKYGFGGKEYDDSMDLNTYDFGARNYVPALGRWMNIDPLAENYSAISPYVYGLNNPLFFIDPDGRKIRNADEERRKKDEAENKRSKEALAENAAYLGISVNSSRREFKKAAVAKGGKKEWGFTKNLLQWNNDTESDLKNSTKASASTESKISDFKKSDLEKFTAMDNIKNEYDEEVDIMMSTENLSNANGENEFSFELNSNKNEARVSTKEFGINTLLIKINPFMQESYRKTTPTTLQAVKHEMGHANYTIQNTMAYYNFTQNVKKFNKGHSLKDKSGQRAEQWEDE